MFAINGAFTLSTHKIKMLKLEATKKKAIFYFMKIFC